MLVLYCWETWSILAVKAAVPVLEAAFQVNEMYGWVAAWTTLDLPAEPSETGP
ncbi:MAG: hypothetical protein ACYC63_00545 [Armatimonadota bacterium]